MRPNGAGVVLCGGRSSRMGRPKALLPWRGRTLVEHVVSVLRRVVDEVVVVGSEALELPRLEARLLRDRTPDLGPLGGIREALHVVEAELAFVASTDAPFLSSRFVEAMLAQGKAAACEVDGHIQTLGAVYETKHAPTADALIAEGRMRPLFLLEACGYRKLSAEEVPDTTSMQGLNTPEAYLHALSDLEEPQTARLELLGTARRRAGIEQIDVPPGTLAEVLGAAEPRATLIEDGAVAASYLVSLNARDFVRDLRIPIGPGDHVLVMDSSAGG